MPNLNETVLGVQKAEDLERPISREPAVIDVNWGLSAAIKIKIVGKSRVAFHSTKYSGIFGRMESALGLVRGIREYQSHSP